MCREDQSFDGEGGWDVKAHEAPVVVHKAAARTVRRNGTVYDGHDGELGPTYAGQVSPRYKSGEDLELHTLGE